MVRYHKIIKLNFKDLKQILEKYFLNCFQPLVPGFELLHQHDHLLRLELGLQGILRSNDQVKFATSTHRDRTRAILKNHH